MGRVPEPRRATFKRTLLADATAALASRPDWRIVKLADGANDNRAYLSSILPDGVEILDFYHAAKHLNAAVASVRARLGVAGRDVSNRGHDVAQCRPVSTGGSLETSMKGVSAGPTPICMCSMDAAGARQ
jgi:hypothetical protein